MDFADLATHRLQESIFCGYCPHCPTSWLYRPMVSKFILQLWVLSSEWWTCCSVCNSLFLIHRSTVFNEQFWVSINACITYKLYPTVWDKITIKHCTSHYIQIQCNFSIPSLRLYRIMAPANPKSSHVYQIRPSPVPATSLARFGRMWQMPVQLHCIQFITDKN